MMNRNDWDLRRRRWVTAWGEAARSDWPLPSETSTPGRRDFLNVISKVCIHSKLELERPNFVWLWFGLNQVEHESIFCQR